MPIPRPLRLLFSLSARMTGQTQATTACQAPGFLTQGIGEILQLLSASRDVRQILQETRMAPEKNYQTKLGDMGDSAKPADSR